MNYYTKLLNPKALEHARANGAGPNPSNKAESTLQTGLLTPQDVMDQNVPQKLVQEASAVTTTDNIAMKIASSLNIRDVIKTLYQESSRLVDTSNFALAIFDDQTDALAFPLVFYQGRRRKPFLVRRSHIRGLISDTLTHRLPLRISDIFEFGRSAPYDPIRPAQPIRSWLSVPISIPSHPNENARGAIIVWNNQPDTFTQQQALQLSALGPPAAIAIRTIQLHQTVKRQALEIAVNGNSIQTLTTTLNLDEVLKRMMGFTEQTLKVEAGVLLLTDQASQELVFQIALGKAQRASVKPFRLPKDDSIASHVAFVGKEPELIARVGPDNQPYIKLASLLQVIPRNCLYVPLLLKEQVIGVLAVMNKTEGTFTHLDMNLLTSIATCAALAIENARLHESRLAERDRALAIEEEARKEWARELHDGLTQEVSGMMMHLDYCRKRAVKEDPSLAEEISEIQKLCQMAIHTLRSHLGESRPLELEDDGPGLVAALLSFLKRRQEGLKETNLIPNIVSYHPNHQISRQDRQVEKAIYNIVQEAVNNAIKHARASRIVIRLEETSDMIQVLIADNGKGFDVTKTMENYVQRGSLGMINLRERTEAIGGELDINSAPGKGTYIALKVPKSKATRLRKRGVTGLLSLTDNLPTIENTQYRSD